MHRFGQAKAISRSVSSVTHEQDDIFNDPNKGHVVTADRIAASESLWQAVKSSSRNCGQLSETCAMLVRLRDNI